MHHGLTEPPTTTYEDEHEPTEVSSFPLTREEFEADSRVSWSRITAKWTLEADDGSEFEFDQVLKRWIPVVYIVPPATSLSGLLTDLWRS